MKTLIKKATEKGFESRLPINVTDKDYYPYLWLCELQKWLFDNHKIWIQSMPIAEDVKKGIYWHVRIWDLRGVGRTLAQTINGTGDPYKTIESALSEALTLIKKTPNN